MFSTLMTISTEQGKLSPSPRSIGAFDAHLLDDIDYDAKLAMGARHRTALTPRLGLALPIAGAGHGLPTTLARSSPCIRIGGASCSAVPTGSANESERGDRRPIAVKAVDMVQPPSSPSTGPNPRKL